MVKLERILSGPGISLLHGFNGSYIGALLESCPTLLKFPLLLTMTGTDLTEPALRDPLCLKALEHSQAITIFHPFFRRILNTAVPTCDQKIYCIPQGVALPPHNPRKSIIPPRTSNEIRMLLPSGLRPAKDIHLVLDAFQAIKPDNPTLSLYIAGCRIDPAYASEIENRLDTIVDANYLGELPFAQMPNFYAQGDIVINSSIQEGQPQAALEAMSLGLPALLRAVPGNLGIMQNGLEGYYFKTADDLSQFCTILIRHPDRRRAMGKAAQTLIRHDFSAPKEIAAYAELYQRWI